MNVSSDLAHYKYLPEWVPQVGDIIVYHGWFFNHWYGIVSYIDAANHNLSVVKRGLPVLVLTMDPGELKKHTVEISISDIKRSTGGKYAAIRAFGGNLIWYI